MLDAEFGAFQAGQLPQYLDGHQSLNLPQRLPIHGHPRSFELPNQPRPEWVSDFQSLNLHDNQPSFTPSQSTAPASWHQDFLERPATNQPQRQARTSQQPFFRGGNAYQANSPYNLAMPQPVHQEAAFDHRQGQEHSQDLDDALFEKHFAAAALEVDQIMGQAEVDGQPITAESLEHTQKDQAFDTATLLGPSIQREIQPEPTIDADVHVSIGSDRIFLNGNSNGKAKQHEAQDEGDELAQTAGRLLENVKHDQSQKFKQSNFLTLMRQLRDRELKVEGDRIVGVSIRS